MSDSFVKQVVEHSREPIASLKNLSAATDEKVVKEHLQALEAEREFWKHTFSNKICFSCLVEPPDFSLRCGHMICSSCVKVLGRQLGQECAYSLACCPLCSEGNQRPHQPLAQIQLKPENTGVRVLAVDGGGVRGVVSARILQLLEREIGLDLPLFYFFDVIIGTSSGMLLPFPFELYFSNSIALHRKQGGKMLKAFQEVSYP
jgi:hypothetical protein